jgi:purine-binding chemotaxis protein CheW
MEEAMQTASPEKSPADDAKGARTAFKPAPPESNPTVRMEHLDTIADREGKYLTFTLAGEEYGIGILKIKEIIGMMPITSVPQTPQFVKGVINLRGKVIPVVDLRLRFAMEAIDYNERTCIIVVEIGGRGADIVIGIVVDSVSEVLNIKSEDIEDTPTFGTRLNTDYILGMAKMEGKVKILLDIDTVLSQNEIHMLQRAA